MLICFLYFQDLDHGKLLYWASWCLFWRFFRVETDFIARFSKIVLVFSGSSLGLGGQNPKLIPTKFSICTCDPLVISLAIGDDSLITIFLLIPWPWNTMSLVISSWSRLFELKKKTLNHLNISSSQSCIRSIHFTSTVFDGGLSVIPINCCFSLCIALSRNSIARVAITVITANEGYGQSVIKKNMIKTVKKIKRLYWPYTNLQLRKFLSSYKESNHHDLPLMKISLAVAHRWSSFQKQKQSLKKVDGTAAIEFTRRCSFSFVQCFSSTLVTSFNIIQTLLISSQKFE